MGDMISGIGSIFGGGKSSSGSTTTSTSPWSGQQPYLTKGFSKADQLYNSGALTPKAYQGQSVAGISPFTNMAQNQIMNRANHGTTPLLAEGLVKDTLSGDYLDIRKNPAFSQGLKDISNAYRTGTAAQTDAAAARSGAYGGSAYNEVVGNNQRMYADALNKFAGDIYNTERANQQNALALSPQINELGYSGSDKLASLGDYNRSYNQDLINADIEKFNIEQNAQRSALADYLGLIQGNYGSTSTQTSQGAKGDKLSGAIGGAATGAQAGSYFGPWGAAIGGIGGGLLGAFKR